MDSWVLILNIVILLALALLFGLALERFKQSAILGYLAAGAILGPGALNLISAGEAVAAMAELGVALLLFTIGLEFSWSRLRKIGGIALGGGTLQIIATGLVTAAVTIALGLPPTVALALGAMIAPSSTACVLRILTARAEIDSIHGRNSLGVLLLQDIALVPLVLVVTLLGGTGDLGALVRELTRTIGLAILFFGGLYLIINHVLSRVLDVTFAARNRELPIVLAGVTCLGSAWIAHAFGVSPALGAFGAGLLLAESPFATQIRADIGGLRTLFVALFFVSIGMLADLKFVRNEWATIIGVVSAIVIGKAAIIWPIARVFGNSHRNALATGICLAQAGEFSFVLAQTGLSMGALSSDLFRLLVSATVVTLFLSPLLVAASMPVGDWVERKLTRLGWTEAPTATPLETTAKLAKHVVIAGMGPSGEGVMNILRHYGIPMVAVDLNARSVVSARQQGFAAEVGDASQEEVLEHLQVASARAVVVSIPDYRAAIQIIRQVRALAPRVLIIARARYHIYAQDLRSAGAHVVVDEEENMGQTLGRELIEHLDLSSEIVLDRKDGRLS